MYIQAHTPGQRLCFFFSHFPYSIRNGISNYFGAYSPILIKDPGPTFLAHKYVHVPDSKV